MPITVSRCGVPSLFEKKTLLYWQGVTIAAFTPLPLLPFCTWEVMRPVVSHKVYDIF